MSETLEKQKIYRSVLESIKMPPGSSKVLIKITDKTTDERTPSGIIKISEMETDWSPATHRNRTGTVMAVPKDPLPFKVGGDLSPWKTTVQISVGMTVWFDFMNMDTYEDDEGAEYKLVNYCDIYVATAPVDHAHGVRSIQKSVDGKEWVIPLNGYSLFERVYKKRRGRFDIFESEKVDRSKGIVKYVAKRNEAYESGVEDDHVDLQVGDNVQFSVVPEVMLEDPAHLRFDSGRMYRRAQARNIDLVWRGDELVLPKGRILIKKIKDERVLPSGIILLRDNVKNHRGEVVISSIEGVNVGQEVTYPLKGGVPLEYKEEPGEHRILRSNQVLYVD